MGHSSNGTTTGSAAFGSAAINELVTWAIGVGRLWPNISCIGTVLLGVVEGSSLSSKSLPCRFMTTSPPASAMLNASRVFALNSVRLYMLSYFTACTSCNVSFLPTESFVLACYRGVAPLEEKLEGMICRWERGDRYSEGAFVLRTI